MAVEVEGKTEAKQVPGMNREGGGRLWLFNISLILNSVGQNLNIIELKDLWCHELNCLLCL